MAYGSSRSGTQRFGVPRAVRAAFADPGAGTGPSETGGTAEATMGAFAAPPAAPAEGMPARTTRPLQDVLDDVAYWSCPPRPPARIHWVGAYASYRHPTDLWAEILSDLENLVVIDARFAEAYAREHIPGAISLPVKTIDANTTVGLPHDATIVVYCWNASCHASSKAAARLGALGFQVAELHGGLETWKRLGYPTERG